MHRANPWTCPACGAGELVERARLELEDAFEPVLPAGCYVGLVCNSCTFAGAVLLDYPAALTWTCHVCGDERPDPMILVHTTDRSGDWNLPPRSMLENVRYCADRPACRDGARRKTWLEAPA